MKTRRRLTRDESRELTRERLIEAAERMFARKGFDEASVEEISESAGYSRGAFYSNFAGKEEVLLSIIDRRRPQALRTVDDLFLQILDPAQHIAAVREWFSNQWRLKDLVALRMEFSRTAMRDRVVRKHLSELRRQELQTVAASVCRYASAMGNSPAERPEVIALVLLAVIYGLATIAIDNDSEWEHLYTEAAKLAFDRMSAPQISQLG